jgi:virulence-associated protein VagC
MKRNEKKEKEVSATAKLVCDGAYQYVLLPKGFEFEGDHVLIDRYRSGVIVKPLPANRAKPGRRTRSR